MIDRLAALGCPGPGACAVVRDLQRSAARAGDREGRDGGWSWCLVTPRYRLLYARYYEAARAAIFPTFLGPDVASVSASRRGRLVSASTGLSRVTARWQKRVTALGAAGWPRAMTRETRSYLRRCPPPGVDHRGGPLRHLCEARRICPYCYGRAYVVPAYRRLAPLLGPDRWLVLTSVRLPDAVVGDPQAVATATASRHDEYRRFRGLAGVVLHFVLPASQALQVHRVGIFITDRDPSQRMVAVGLPRIDVEAEPADTPDRLVVAVGRALAYPQPLLTADPQRMLQALQTVEMSRRRTFFQYGGRHDV